MGAVMVWGWVLRLLQAGGLGRRLTAPCGRGVGIRFSSCDPFSFGELEWRHLYFRETLMEETNTKGFKFFAMKFKAFGPGVAWNRFGRIWD